MINIPYIIKWPDNGVCGIYAIYNIVNHKFYIGSSFNIKKRWVSDHRPALNANRHVNKFLQNAWNKYGSENFILIVLEKTERYDILLREQYYFDLYQSYNNQYGYNLNKIAGKVSFDETEEQKKARILKRSKPFKFKTVFGEIIEGRNLKDFCEKNGILQNLRRMREVAKPNSNSISYPYVSINNDTYNGVFTENESKRSIKRKIAQKSASHEFSFYETNSGKTFVGTNLLSFCRENNLSYNQMTRVRNGKILKYKGFIKSENKDKIVSIFNTL